MKSVIFLSFLALVMSLTGKYSNSVVQVPGFGYNTYKQKIKKNDARKKSFTIEELRAIKNPEQSHLYQTINNGGGLWLYDPKDKSSMDNTGSILVTQSGRRFKRLYNPAKGINIEWFGGEGDGKTDNASAFEKAKAALLDGGIINFGKGTYTSRKMWLVNKSDIFLKGVGANETILTADTSVARTFAVNLDRSIDSVFVQGRDGNPGELYPFVNNTKKGDSYIELKNADWAKDFPVGQEIFIRAGASYYDQEFGEMNFVVKKEDMRLYLRYPLSRNYSYEKENWNGIIMQNFTPPPVGETATIVMKKPPTKNNIPISIGNDIYNVTNVQGNLVTIKNPGRENSTAIVKAGTWVAKGRQVIKCFYKQNFRMEGITILGRQTRVFSINNSAHATIKNCVIIRNPPSAQPGAFTFTVDCARDVTFDNVQFTAPDNIVSVGQISRSSGNITFKNCTFKNVATDFSEFCFNIVVDSCAYNMKGCNFATRLGKSTTNSKTTNSSFKVDDTYFVITMDDIQGFRETQREGSVVDHCSFDLHNVGGILLNAGKGTNEFTNNTVTGEFKTFCATLRNKPTAENPNTPEKVYIANNTVTANVQAYLFNTGNATIENNTFTFQGNLSNHPAAGEAVHQQKNDTLSSGEFIFRNNHFNNWVKKANAINVADKKFITPANVSGNIFK